MKTIILAAALAALPTELALRAQLLGLQEQLVKTQVALYTCQANNDKAALEAEVFKALGGQPGQVVDWSTNPPSLKAK